MLIIKKAHRLAVGFLCLRCVESGLPDHAQLAVGAKPTHLAAVLGFGGVEVIQVLLQIGFLELCEKLRLRGRIVLTDVFDQLTFGHGVLLSRLKLS